MMRNLKNCATSITALAAVLLLAASAAFAQEAKANTQKDSAQTARSTTDETIAPSTTVETSAPATTATAPGKPMTATASKSGNTKSAPAPQAADDDAWHLEIRPYLWLAGITGDFRINNLTVNKTASAGDLLGMLDFAFATQIEAKKGRLTVMLDEDYINLGTDSTGPTGVVTQIEPTMNIFEFGGSYEAVSVPNKEGTSAKPLPPTFSMELLGGGRYVHLGLGLQRGTGAEVSGSRNLIDAFGGTRLKIRPKPPITIIGKFTVGAGGTHLSWTAGGYVDLRFKKNMSLTAGYQVLYLDANQATNTVGFKGRMRGLFLGMTLYR